jgi:spermidine/putrescine transport system ATP-binding protein
VIDLPGLAKTGQVTVTVRPEQVRLVAADEAGAIPATVKSMVYFGTDTHCNLLLKDGSEVVARLQSPATGEAGLEQGQQVGLRFAPGAAQIVED